MSRLRFRYALLKLFGQKALNIPGSKFESALMPWNLDLFRLHKVTTADFGAVLENEIFWELSRNEVITLNRPSTILKTISVNDAIFDFKTGVVCLSEDKPIPLLESARALFLNQIDGDGLRKPPKVIQGDWICLSGRSYAHWLLEDLPSFLRLRERFPEAEVATSRFSPTYVHGLMDFLQLTNSKFDMLARFERVHFSTFPYLSGPPTLEDLQVVRDLASKNLERNGTLKDSEKIYVSRRNATRSLGDEIEMELVLKEEGFRIVRLEDLNWREQVAIFAGAKLVIGPHGAGLANIVFCQPNTRVIEIFKRNHRNQNYSHCARLLNLDYGSILESTSMPSTIEEIKKYINEL